MKNTVKIASLALLGGALAMGTVSCKKKGCTDATATNFNSEAKKDDGSCEYAAKPATANEVLKSGAITADETWTADKCYVLNGRVWVDNNSTLTIEPGTIIKGATGSDVNASALIIATGSKIMAEGTAAKPIIFTSKLDNIEIGSTSGTNLGETDSGKWGGLILLGKAPISAEAGDNISQIEGIPATEPYGTFGGNDVADNSGVLKYVSVRHGGALIGAGNEINGITFGGVGNGTVVENIEIISNLDDGIEFFGGTVNVSNVAVGFQGDDGIDIDMNYAGTVNNFFVFGGTSSDEGLEVDGPEATLTDGLFTLSNGTVMSATGDGSGSDFKSKAQGNVQNVVFSGYSSDAVKLRASFSDAGNCTLKTDAYTNATDATPNLLFSNVEVANTTIVDGVSVYTKTENADACISSLEAPAETAVNPTVVTAPTVGGTASDFTWTWLSAKGKF